MVPPTEPPYGPVNRDICYNFKVAPNCAIGTMLHCIKLLEIWPEGRGNRGENAGRKDDVSGYTGGRWITYNMLNTSKATAHSNEDPGRPRLSTLLAHAVLTEMTFDWKSSKRKCKIMKQRCGETVGWEEGEEGNWWAVRTKDDGTEQM